MELYNVEVRRQGETLVKGRLSFVPRIGESIGLSKWDTVYEVISVLHIFTENGECPHIIVSVEIKKRAKRNQFLERIVRSTDKPSPETIHKKIKVTQYLDNNRNIQNRTDDQNYFIDIFIEEKPSLFSSDYLIDRCHCFALSVIEHGIESFAIMVKKEELFKFIPEWGFFVTNYNPDRNSLYALCQTDICLAIFRPEKEIA